MVLWAACKGSGVKGISYLCGGKVSVFRSTTNRKVTKVVVVGSGVGGLCTASLALRAGHRVTVCEASSRAGGLCTGWDRGAYHFNGCLHWVLGARPGSSFHTLWQRVLDIDALPWRTFDERVAIDFGHFTFHYYNSQPHLREHLLSLATSPGDRRRVERWMDDVATVLRHVHCLPPVFPEGTPWYSRLASQAAMAELIPILYRWRGLTTWSWAAGFTTPALRLVVHNLQSVETPMQAIIFGQAYVASGAAAYPIGGSRAFVDKLLEACQEATFRYNTRVASLLTESNSVRGVTLDSGEQLPADLVVDDTPPGTLYPNPYTLNADSLYHSYVRLHLGVAAPLLNQPHLQRFQASVALPDGTRAQWLEVETLHYDPTLAPAGCCTVAVNVPTYNGSWWIGLRRDAPEAYRTAKQEVARALLEQTRRVVPGDRVQECDVVTPATYARYTGNPGGSTQGWRPGADLTRGAAKSSHNCPGYARVGQWTVAGGGLPVCLKSACEIKL